MLLGLIGIISKVLKMKIFTVVLILFSVLSARAQGDYTQDILGDNFEQKTLYLGEDYDGEVVATLVRRTPLEGVKRAVLYVHGYNDYFFQSVMADRFAANDYQFYAVDLRKYGRSLREGDIPFKMRKIEEYFADIDSSIDVMLSEGVEEIVLMGHSTGGLITSLYTDSRAGKYPIKALILNSPFFDMNLSPVLEGVALPVISFIGRAIKDIVVMPASDSLSLYARSLLEEYDGEWSFDTRLKTSHSEAITSGWLRAIHSAQRKLRRGLDIECPVLVMYSDKSVTGAWSEEYLTSDSVLDVEDINRYAERLGEDVTEVVIKDGMHDLILSGAQARNSAYAAMFEFLGGVF